MGDVVLKLAELKKVYDQINTLRKAGTDVRRSFEAYDRLARTGTLTGDDEATIVADAVSRRFEDLFRTCARWTETQWIEQTDYNLLSPATYGPAIAALKQDRERFRGLREAFLGLALLLQTARVADRLDVKKLAKAWVPSLIVLDEIHRQDVIARFNGLATTMEQIGRRLDHVLAAIDRPVAPVAGGFEFAKLRPGTTVITRVAVLRGRQWAHPAFCRLTADVPAGTRFTVRGIQTIEKWFDVEAAHLVGLTLRCSAAEGAAIFSVA